MRSIVLVLACLAGVGHTRKLITTKTQRRPHVSLEPHPSRASAGGTSTNALTGLLIALNPRPALRASPSIEHSPHAAFKMHAKRGSSTIASARSHEFDPLSLLSDRPTIESSEHKSKDEDEAASDEITRIMPLMAMTAGLAFMPAAGFAGDLSFQAADHTSTLLAFADQANNLAGPLFASSLFPYLIFLYFLRQDVNGLSPVAKAGFTFLLAFVAGTIGCSIASVKMFGVSLANSDWLHSYAEQLLAFTNIIDVIGLKFTLDAFSSGKVTQPATAEQIAQYKVGEGPVIAAATAVAALTCVLTVVANGGGDFTAHTPYLGGFGDLPPDFLPFSEPENALTMPTWLIHASSLLEWLVAQGLIWRIALASGNEKWKGMTWGMIPSHCSGIVACTYHIFYNGIQDLVILQSALTLIGNTALAIAAYRIAASNGWEFSLPSFQGAEQPSVSGDIAASQDEGSGDIAASQDSAPNRASLGPDADNLAGSFATVFALSLVSSYLVKYGGAAAAPITTAAPEWLALLVVFLPSAFNIYKWNERSKTGGDFKGII